MNNDEIVIQFNHVTKMYKLFKNDKRRLMYTFFKNIKYKEKKAVDDVSFKIKKGETVALFGKNGAGKSTILKMITGVCFPTNGDIEVKGRVSALLELTSGFDPEFTGRENIYLKGQLLGISDTEIKELEPDIIAFAEISEYIDQPVRTYSSGMKARLGFSINVNIKPEILIVDEILSVGDIAFQQKSEEKMKSMIGGGTTVLFVSHSLAQIKNICDRAVWLDHGQVKKIGPAKEICDEYYNSQMS